MEHPIMYYVSKYGQMPNYMYVNRRELKNLEPWLYLATMRKGRVYSALTVLRVLQYS